MPHPLILKFSETEPTRTSATPCLRNVLFFHAESGTQINAASIPKECLPHPSFRFPVITPHDSNLKMPASLSRACDLSQTIKIRLSHADAHACSPPTSPQYQNPHNHASATAGDRFEHSAGNAVLSSTSRTTASHRKGRLSSPQTPSLPLPTQRSLGKPSG